MRRNLVIAATLMVWSTFLLAQGPPDEELLAQGVQEAAVDPLPVADVPTLPVDRQLELEDLDIPSQ